MKKQFENTKRVKVVGYCRVSTDNQKEEGTIEIQEVAIREYCKKNRYELIDLFEDNGISGSKDLDHRPGLANLFDYIDENPGSIQKLIVFKLDRLARDLRLQENLIYDIQAKKKIDLISIKESDLCGNDPHRVLIRQVLGSFAQYEKSVIAMRLELGRNRKANKGGYAGGNVSLGYKVQNSELKIDESSAETVKSIFHMKRYNRLSLNEIARELNRKGIPTARGGKWYARTIKYILENPLYKGELSYKENTVKREDLTLINKAGN